MDLKHQADRLRALWKSGRDKYTSFFTVLKEVQDEIGAEALSKWCFDELHIGISVINNAAGLLREIDAKVTKDQFAAAKVKQQEAEAQARRARELAKEEEKQKVAAAKLEAAKRAREQAEAEREEARKMAAVRAETAKLQKKGKTKKKKTGTSKDKARRRQRDIVASISDADLVELVKRYKKADQLCVSGIEQWIEGSIAKCLVLSQMRKAHPADQDFGVWLEGNGIELDADTRAALIGLGQLGKDRLRELLSSTDSRSYRTIWRQNRPLKAVE